MTPASSPSLQKLTVLAWIVLVMGASEPIRQILNWYQQRGMLDLFGFLRRHPYSFGVDITLHLALGAMGAWGGWALLQRRSQAPLFACIAGGPIVVESGYWLYALAIPSIRVIAGAIAPKYIRLILVMGLPVVLNLTLVVSWLLILSHVLRQKGRLEFEKPGEEVNSGSLWIALTLSSSLLSLILLLQHLMWAAESPTGQRTIPGVELSLGLPPIHGKSRSTIVSPESSPAGGRVFGRPRQPNRCCVAIAGLDSMMSRCSSP